MMRTQSWLGPTLALCTVACSTDDSIEPAWEPPATVAPAQSAQWTEMLDEPTGGGVSDTADASSPQRDAGPPDDGVHCERRHRFEYPPEANVLGATKPWLNVAPYYAGVSSVQAAGDGGAYVLGSFGKELDLGAGRLETSAPASTFVHKLDADCNPLRTWKVHTSDATHASMPAGIAIDPQGNVYVASVSGVPRDSYLMLYRTPLSWLNTLAIEKFSPEGTSLYRFEASASSDAAIGGIEVNEAGELFVTAQVPETTDLGSGAPIGPNAAIQRTVLFKLAADGTYATHVANTGTLRFALAGDQVYRLDSWYKWSELSAEGLPIITENSPDALTSVSQGDLSQRWQKEFFRHLDGEPSAMTVAGNLAVLYRQAVPDGDDVIKRSQVIKRYDLDGTLIRATSFFDQRVRAQAIPDGGSAEEILRALASDSFYFSYLKQSEPGTLVLAGTFTLGQQIAGTTLTSKSISLPSGNGFFSYHQGGQLVIKLDQNDAIRWVRQQDWGTPTLLRGVSSRDDGSVFVVGEARLEGDPQSPGVPWEVVFRRLRAN